MSKATGASTFKSQVVNLCLNQALWSRRRHKSGSLGCCGGTHGALFTGMADAVITNNALSRVEHQAKSLNFSLTVQFHKRSGTQLPNRLHY